MALTVGDVVYDDARRPLTLGKLVKSGGAGSVYLLKGATSQVAKIYHAEVDHATYARKVEAMLRLSPDLPDIVDGGQRRVQIAWPTSLLRDRNGGFVGFLMPALDVDATSELEMILQEKQARAAGLPTGLGAKMTLAANLSAVVAALHLKQHTIVDLKPVNLRFYRGSLYMAMLDCDGFGIQGVGERFSAPQFTPDYLAPEFQRGGITPEGEQSQDRFALAVVVFQLLNFGLHPFSGRPANAQVPTDIPSRIAGRYYAYGVKPNASIAPSPVSGHARMPSELRALFDRAFESRGHGRPSAAEWKDALESYARRSTQRMIVCTSDATHQHYSGYACAQCDRAQVLRKARAAQPARVQHARTTTATTRGHAFRQRLAKRPAQTYIPPVRMPPMPQPRVPQGNPIWSAIGSFLLSNPRVIFGLIGLVLMLVLKLAGNWSTPTRYSVPLPTPAASARVETPPEPALPVPARDLDWIEATASLAGEYNADIPYYVDTLRTRAIQSKSPSPATMQIFREALDIYASSPTDASSEWAARDALKTVLTDMLARDRNASQVAFELGLLQMRDNETDAARGSFLHAIAVAPADPAGWYGLAVLKSPQVQDMYGALSIAEGLARRNEDKAQPLRERVLGTMEAIGDDRMNATDRHAVSRFALKSDGRTPVDYSVDARRFAAVLARARVRVAEGATLPPDVKKLAEGPLPQ